MSREVKRVPLDFDAPTGKVWSGYQAAENVEPPTGDGWQLWETVSEGSPISPVFADADGLTVWMSDPDRGHEWVPESVARTFIEAGWAPTGFGGPNGFQSGVEFIGMAGGGDRG